MSRSIHKVLRETASATVGVKSFGRGAVHFANISDQETPRVWIHQVSPIDAFKFGMTTTFRIVGEVTDLYDFDADSDGTMIEDLMTSIEPIYERFITNLSKQPEFLSFGSDGIRRTEIIHRGDRNLAGYAFVMTVSIKKTTAQQCL